ncbi:hypothetical protein BCR32DRAFT_289336 [Anaeromyces robustus]|uniref:Uncharacterized protein n=1 Tax=Anaeromyces robustus TaxID=1754192 RepID=A0A1Y1XPB8_9FUNG|nr:hypothetical protein BCR32DRAFT_289336 [Anaeromyces robustus]|eukprot:ORX87515.1 hypothetical protein BCR32DRAFT_289336 [Anaeromyces robustus]
MTSIEYSSGPDKVPLHFYISRNSTTHNNYQRIYEREKPKCPCRKYYHGDDSECLHCKNSKSKSSPEEDSRGLIHDLLKNVTKQEVKTGFSNNKNPYVVYDKNIDENDHFRDDFHWLTTYNDKYKDPKYKDKGNNILTIVEDGYTRGIKNIWDPTMHTKDDDISVMKKDYTLKRNNTSICTKDNVIDTNSGYCTNSSKIHTYKDLADYVDNDYDYIDKDRKIDSYYNKDVFPSYIEDDGFTRKGNINSYMDLAPKFEDNEKKSINLPSVNEKSTKPFEQFKTITQNDYTFLPVNIYERLKVNVDKSNADKNQIYSGLSYIPNKSDPNDFITEHMDKYRDNKESKKVEEQLKHPFVCDYMLDDGYTKGNRNSKGLICNGHGKKELKDEDGFYICPCQYQSRLYLKRHGELTKLPVNPQNSKPDTQISNYLKMTKNKS